MKMSGLWKKIFGSDKQNQQKNRNLKVEALEERQLLSVTPDYGWYTTDPAATEFEIDTAGELVGLANIVNGLDSQTVDTFSGKTVKLTGDIDLSDIGAGEWNPIGTGSNMFAGNFDGQNHSITNLTITEFKNNEEAGLFGWVRGADPKNAELTNKIFTSSIKNVNLSGNISIEWSDPTDTNTNVYVGLLVGQGAGYGIIENCNVDGSIQLKYSGTEADAATLMAGGVVGDLWTGSINSVTSSVTLKVETPNNTETAYSGGVVGFSTGNAGDLLYVTNSSYVGPVTETYNIYTVNGGNVTSGGFCAQEGNLQGIYDRISVTNTNIFAESKGNAVRVGGLNGTVSGGTNGSSPARQLTNCNIEANLNALAYNSYTRAGGINGSIGVGESYYIANNFYSGTINAETTSNEKNVVSVGGMFGFMENDYPNTGNGFTLVDNYIGEGTTVKVDNTSISAENIAVSPLNIGGIVGNVSTANIRVIQNKVTDIPDITTTTAQGTSIVQGFVVGNTNGTTTLLVDQAIVDKSNFALVGASADQVTLILGEDITLPEYGNLLIDSNQNVVLNLNGFKLSSSGSSVIENKGTLKITDSSEAQSGIVENTKVTSAGAYAISNEGTLEIQAGKYIGKKANAAAEALLLKDGSTALLSGGSYSSPDNTSFYTSEGSVTLTHPGYSEVPVTGTTQSEIAITSAKIRIIDSAKNVTTADTLADALTNAEAGSTLILTEGEYEMTAAVRLMGKNLTIKGEGKVVIKFTADETQTASLFEISATVNFEKVIFSGSTQGVFVNSGNLSLKNCSVVNNTGGAVFTGSAGTLKMVNTIIANNTVTGSGALIENTGTTTNACYMKIINCTFVKNTVQDENSAIIVMNSLDESIYENYVCNCILVDNQVGLVSSNLITGAYGGAGNFTEGAHPEFFNGTYPVDAEGWVNWNGEISTSATSLINKGDEGFVVPFSLGVTNYNWTTVTDYAGNLRKSGSLIDIGAYELDYIETPVITSITSDSAESIKLTWAINNAAGFNIYISTDDANFEKVDDAQLVISGYSAIVSGLDPNTKYWFKMNAENSAGSISDDSNTVDSWTLVAAPINFKAVANAANTVTVTFEDGDPLHGVTGYRLYQKTSDSDYVDITNDTNVTWDSTYKATITGLIEGTTYTYKLSALNEDNKENFAVETPSATVYTDFPISTTFAATSSDITSNSFKVDLTNILNANDVNGTYTVSVYTSADFSESSLVETKTLTPTSSDITDPVQFTFDSNLTSNTDYYIKVFVWGKNEENVPAYFAQDNSLSVLTNCVMTDNSTGYNNTYDAAEHGITVNLQGQGGGALTNLVVKYKDAEGNYTLDNCPQYTNAGSYTVSYKATADNYDDLYGSRDVIIGKVNLTVSGTTVKTEKIYDETANAEVTVQGTPSPFAGQDASKVTFTTTASYNDANVETDKTITVHYVLTDNVDGSNIAVNYILPEDYTYSTDGIITADKLATPVVTVGTVTDTTVDLSWAKITNATSYTVECWIGMTKVTPTITVTEGTENVTAAVSGLTANTLYTFKVKANPAASDTNREASDWGLAETITHAAVPANVTASGTTDTSITVAWDANNATSFKVYMSETGEEGSYNLVASDITAYSAVISNLTSNTRYWFKVSAVNSATPGIETAQSNAAGTYTHAAVPANVTASGTTDTSITVAWDANNAASFKVYMSETGEEGSYNLVASDITAYSAVISNLSANTQYWFKVSAVNSATPGIETAQSNAADTYTHAAVPANVTASGTTDTSITVAWDANNAASFKVYMSETGEEGSYNLVASDITAYSAVISNLSANTQYWFKVSAVNSATPGIETAQSNAADTYTLAAVPANVTASGTTDTSITVAWDANNAASFKVYMSETGEEGSYNLVASDITAYSAVISNLSANTRYWFKVSAVNSATPGIETAQSDAANAYTLAAVPDNLWTFDAKPTYAWLKWTADNASSYAVYKSTTGAIPDDTYSRVSEEDLVFGTDGNSVYVYQLTGGNDYWFKISAFNADGIESEKSDYTHLRTPLTTPVCRELEVTVDSIAVEWDPIASAEGYEARYQLLNASEWIEDLEVTDCATMVSGLASNTVYSFQVRAVKGEIVSEWSEPLQVTTLKEIPLPPEAPETTPVSTNAINVSWTPVAEDQFLFVDGYKINVFKKDGTIVKTVEVDGAETNSRLVDGLETGTEYDFVIYTEPSDIGKLGGYGETLLAEVSGHTEYDKSYWDLSGLNYDDLTLTASVNDNGIYFAALYANGVSNPIKKADNIGEDATVTIIGNSAIAEQLHINEDAMSLLGNVIFLGGSGKLDRVIIDGTNSVEADDLFTINTEETTVTTPVYTVDPYANLIEYYKGFYGEENPIFKNIQKVFNDAYSRLQKIVATSRSQFNTVDLESGANVKLAGVGAVTINAQGGSDQFKIVNLGANYDLIGGNELDTIDFSAADNRVVIDMGSKYSQYVLPGQLGTVRLHDDIENVTGSSKSDYIVSAANTKEINGNGGTDAVVLNGNADTQTEVNLNGRSQSVLIRGDGQYQVKIDNGDYSIVNALAASDRASLDLEIYGRNTITYGTRGADHVEVFGDYAYVNTGSGADTIFIAGGHATVLAGDGNDIIGFLTTPDGEIRSEGNIVYGEGGNDLINATNTKGNNFFYAGTGNDIVIGGQGSDFIYGMSGNNVLLGNSGEDRIFGGTGRDILLASSTKKINEAFTNPVNYEKLIEDLNNAWCNGDPDLDAAISLIGKESVVDGSKDWIYRGAGYGNMIYMNSKSDKDFGNALIFNPFNDILMDELKDE